MAELPTVYTEPGSKPIPRVRLDDAPYGLALQRFIGLCTDAMIVGFDFSLDKLVAFLAKRKAKPMSSWWMIGGGRMPGETPSQSIVRCFKSETGLTVDEERFGYLCRNSYIWKDRQQQPQDVGCHMEADTFVVVLTHDEMAAIRLDKNEYVDGGLKAFTLSDVNKLVCEGANGVAGQTHQPLLDVFLRCRKQFIDKDSNPLLPHCVECGQLFESNRPYAYSCDSCTDRILDEQRDHGIPG